jgi:hypothetical protein
VSRAEPVVASARVRALPRPNARPEPFVEVPGVLSPRAPDDLIPGAESPIVDDPGCSLGRLAHARSRGYEGPEASRHHAHGLLPRGAYNSSVASGWRGERSATRIQPSQSFKSVLASRAPVLVSLTSHAVPQGASRISPSYAGSSSRRYAGCFIGLVGAGYALDHPGPPTNHP